MLANWEKLITEVKIGGSLACSDHENGQRARTGLLWKLKEVEVFQPGEGKDLGIPYCSLSVYKGSLKRSWRERLFIKPCSDRKRGNSIKLKEAGYKEEMFYNEGGEMAQKSSGCSIMLFIPLSFCNWITAFQLHSSFLLFVLAAVI